MSNQDSAVELDRFQRRAEAALTALKEQGLVTASRVSLIEGQRHVEVIVSVQTDSAAPDFDAAKYEDARRRIGAALHGVDWTIVGEPNARGAHAGEL